VCVCVKRALAITENTLQQNIISKCLNDIWSHMCVNVTGCRCMKNIWMYYVTVYYILLSSFIYMNYRVLNTLNMSMISGVWIMCGLPRFLIKTHTPINHQCFSAGDSARWPQHTRVQDTQAPPRWLMVYYKTTVSPQHDFYLKWAIKPDMKVISVQLQKSGRPSGWVLQDRNTHE